MVYRGWEATENRKSIKRGVTMGERIRTVSFLVVLTLLASFSFPGAYAEAAPPKKVNLALWGGPIGSSGYVLSFGLAEIVNKYSKVINMKAMETKGWAADIMGWQLLPPEESKYLVVAGLSPIHVKQGRDGEKPLKGPFMDARCIALTARMPSPWATADPKLKKAEDLKGKRIIFGGARSAFTFSMVAVLEAWGLPPGNYKLLPGSFEQGCDGIIDGTVDVGYMGSSAWGPGEYKDWAPNPAAERLYSSKVTYIVDPPIEAYKKAKEKTGYPIYAQGLKAQKIGLSSIPNVHGLVNDTSWWVHKDLPDEIVKELVTIIYDHVGEFGKYHATGKYIMRESLAETACPMDWYHADAIKFYKGKGLKFWEEQ
jgi:TRAP transporter TAXI family solute receptor